MGKHKNISDWQLFFSTKVEKFNEMLENTKKFIEDNNLFIDFDGFNEKSETRIGKIVIMCFNDNNRDNFINYFVKECNQFKIHLFIIVCNESENNRIKNNIINSIKEEEEKGINDQIIFKVLNCSDNKYNDLINLNVNLIECSKFDNELGLNINIRDNLSMIFYLIKLKKI